MPSDVANANDVIVTIQGNTAGGSGHVILDAFEYTSENDTQEESGVGNRETQGFSHGNLTASFSATALGDDAVLFNDLAPESDGKAPDCHVSLFGTDSTWNISHWRPSDRTFSGDDGETLEYEAEGPCIPVKEV